MATERLKGICNGAPSKRGCGAVIAHPDKVTELTLPVSKNGFIFLGYKTSYNELAGKVDEKGKKLKKTAWYDLYENTYFCIDLDGYVDYESPFVKKIAEKTMTVESGSHGLHIYFGIEGRHDIDKMMERPINPTLLKSLGNSRVEHIDILTREKVFAPGTRFTEQTPDEIEKGKKPHVQGYRIIGTSEIALISVDNFHSMVKDFIVVPEVDECKELDGLEEEIPYDVTKMRPGFQAMLTGEFQLHRDEVIGLKEFTYIKFLCVEFAKVAGGTYDQLWDYLETHKSQSAFNRTYSEEYIQKYDWSNQAPMTNKTHNKYFPNHKVDTKKKDPVISGLQQDGDGELPQATLLARELITKYNAFWHHELRQMGIYERGRYRLGDELVYNKLRLLYPKTNNRIKSEVKSYIHDMNHLCADDFDVDIKMLNVGNGYWDVINQKVMSHHPNYRCMVQYGFEYNQDIKEMPECFKDYIESTFATEFERKRAVQIMKRILEGRFIWMKDFLICVGPKDAGKGIFYKILGHVMGWEYTSMIRIQDSGGKFSGFDFYNKRLAVDSDASSEDMPSDAISNLKKYTGNEALIRMEGKGANAIYQKNKASIIICANKIPGIGTDEEIGSVSQRPYFLHFRISHDAQPPEWEENLFAEAEEIGSYLLNLPLEDIPKVESEDNASEYWLRESNPAYAWCEDRIDVGQVEHIVYNMNEVDQLILKYSLDKGIVSVRENRKKEIFNRVNKLGGSIFYKQIKNEKNSFIRGVSIRDCAAIDIRSLESSQSSKKIVAADDIESYVEQYEARY
jgi:phage/plasmid-associated DNA primase